MFKKRKLGIAEILYILFCIFNIYILPALAGRNILSKGYGTGFYLLAYWAICARIWINGLGCFVLMLGAAVYEYFDQKSDKRVIKDGALWIYIFTVLPHIAVGLISIVKGYIDGFTAFDNFLPLIFVGAGMWLGRLAAGKYKGIRLFYAADIAYILSCVFLLVFTAVLFKRGNMTEETLYIVGFGLFIISVMYGFFSEFVYIQERLVRAVITAVLLFTAFYPLYLFDAREYEYSYLILLEDLAVRLFKPAFVVTLGVITGYYLRILRFGGDSEPTKTDIKKLMIKFGVAAALIAAVSLAFQGRYRFKKTVNILDSEGIDLSDGAIAYLSTNDGEYVCTDRESVQKIVQSIKTEKGVNVKHLPENDGSESYTVEILDKYGSHILLWKMENKGEVNVKYYDRWLTGYILPRQYYGSESTKAEEYKNIILGSRPQTTQEKIDLIGVIYEYRFDWDAAHALYERYVNDEDKSVRLALAKKMREFYWDDECLERLARDKDADVRAEAYRALGKAGSFANSDTLISLIKEEKDEKCRFYAIVCLGRSFGTSQEHTVRGFLYSGQIKAKTDLEKLAYSCALLESERYGTIIDTAEDCYSRIPDTEEYAEIKNLTRPMIDNAKAVEEEKMVRERDETVYGNEAYYD